jgi:TP901 family phage tail tape measure protein
MAIKETIVLNFQTQLDQAKTDILSLADLYKKSMVAPGQEGAPSSAQRFDVEQLVSERAMEYGVSPDEMKAVLADINTILQEEAEIRNRLQELKDKSLATEAKIKLQEEEKNKLIAEGAEALNLKKTASLQEVTAAKKSLDAQIATGNATKQQLEQHQKVSAIFDQLSTKNRSIGQLISHNLKLNKEQTVLLEQQDDAFSRLRRSALQLNITEDERENIERLLVPSIMDQTNETKALEKAQKRVVKAAKENAAAQEDINNSLRNAPKTFAEKATSAFLYFQAVQAIRRVVRAAVRTLTELDRALTDIAIVTNMSREQTQGLIGTYQEMAKRVGLTTTEVVNLSTAFFRQGRAAADALALTETAAKFARIAAINVNDAANFLTAAINGFNLAASEATRIIDRFAALGASAAASAQEIAIALSKVAPAAASAGVEIDNLMAFVTKAIETTREAPENIGTAFKTIFARMRELSDIGKVMEDGMDVNRVESALKNIGVDLRDASGEFRDLDRVLIEVGHKWDSITRSQQAYVATTLAGTRQQTRLIALFENFDRTLELIDISQRSAGAAAIQHAEFMKGLEAATTNLKTSFQEFITSIASSDQMLFVIDSLRVGIDLLNTVFGKLILTGLAYKALMKGVGIEGSKLKAVKDFLAGSMSKLTTAFGTNTVAVYKSNLAQQKAELASRTAGVAMGKQVAVQEFGRQAALKNALANSKLGLSFASLKKSILAKKLALSTSTIAMQWQTASAAKAQGVLTGLQAAQFKTAIAAQAMGKAFVAAGTKILVIMSKLLLSPLGLVVAIGGIILALKKMADATDTVNPTVAEWQIRIKKANEALKNIIKAIKDFFTNLMTGNGIAARFFQFFLNG